MTTASEHLDVPPPPNSGFVDDWGTAGDGRRVVLGVNRTISDSDVNISTTCIQHLDGHIDDGSTDECPQVHIGSEVDLNSDQARELAGLLLELVAEIDGWVAR